MIQLKQLLTEFGEYRVANSEYFKQYIKDVEGYRNDAYKLKDGMITIGYGHAERIGKSKYKIGDVITKSEAEALLKSDIAIAEKKVDIYMSSNYPNVTLTPLQKQMLTDYAFNPGLSKFPKFVNAVVNKNWKEAKREFKRYYRGQPLGRNKVFYNKFLSQTDKLEPGTAADAGQHIKKSNTAISGLKSLSGIISKSIKNWK